MAQNFLHQPPSARSPTYAVEMPASADSKKKRVANGSPVTHQTVRQQGGTGEDSYTHLADWTLSVAAIEKKKKKKKKKHDHRASEFRSCVKVEVDVLGPRP